jgi:hypothetical protein
MSEIDVDNVTMVLDEMFDHRLARLTAEAPRTAAFYVPLIRKKRAELAPFIGAVKASGVPVADRLKAAKKRQDGHAGALSRHVGALLADAQTPDEVRARAQRVRDALLSGRPVSGGSYSARAALARRLGTKRAEAAAELAALPPLPGGGTVVERVDAWFAESSIINDLLTERADALSRGGPAAGARKVLTATLGLLGRMRAALADERSDAPAMSDDLEAFVFARLDALQTAPRHAAAAEPAPAP